MADNGWNIGGENFIIISAPKNTPKAVVDKLNAVVTAAVGSEGYKSTMAKAGTVPMSSTPDQLASIIAETAKDFDGLIKGLGIKQLD